MMHHEKEIAVRPMWLIFAKLAWKEKTAFSDRRPQHARLQKMSTTQKQMQS